MTIDLKKCTPKNKKRVNKRRATADPMFCVFVTVLALFVAVVLIAAVIERGQALGDTETLTGETTEQDVSSESVPETESEGWIPSETAR